MWSARLFPEMGFCGLRPSVVGFLVRNMAGQDSDPIIKTYLREIMETPLLTPQEEIELAARIKRETKRLGL
jgi:DNA-directed RNA polymerase sigma subunit (sigma70/sigma32)